MSVVGEPQMPGAIQAFVILNVLGALLLPIVVIGYFADASVPRWYPPFLSIYSLTILLCLIGIWQLSRKALFVYMGAILVNQLVHIYLRSSMAGTDVPSSIQPWNPMSLLLPVFLIGAALFHVKKFK